MTDSPVTPNQPDPSPTPTEESEKPSTPENPNARRIKELNATIRYAMWSVFKVATPLPRDEATRAEMAAEVEELFTRLGADDLVVRGRTERAIYTVHSSNPLTSIR